MARRQKQILTSTEQQQEIQLLKQRIAQLEAGGQTTTKQRRTQTTRNQATNAQPKVPRVPIRPMIPEAHLENKNYLVQQYRQTHPWLSESEALGDLCVQSFNMAMPRVKRQEEARLAKQTQQTPQLTQRATAAPA